MNATTAAPKAAVALARDQRQFVPGPNTAVPGGGMPRSYQASKFPMSNVPTHPSEVAAVPGAGR